MAGASFQCTSGLRTVFLQITSSISYKKLHTCLSSLFYYYFSTYQWVEQFLFNAVNILRTSYSWQIKSQLQATVFVRFGDLEVEWQFYSKIKKEKNDNCEVIKDIVGSHVIKDTDSFFKAAKKAAQPRTSKVEGQLNVLAITCKRRKVVSHFNYIRNKFYVAFIIIINKAYVLQGMIVKVHYFD